MFAYCKHDIWVLPIDSSRPTSQLFLPPLRLSRDFILITPSSQHSLIFRGRGWISGHHSESRVTYHSEDGFFFRGLEATSWVGLDWVADYLDSGKILEIRNRWPIQPALPFTGLSLSLAYPLARISKNKRALMWNDFFFFLVKYQYCCQKQSSN